MNLLSQPPVREPMADLIDSPITGEPVIDVIPDIWIAWFSELLEVINLSQGTGTTAQRPNPAPFIGFMYYDTTIDRPIWAKTATTWVNANGVLS